MGTLMVTTAIEALKKAGLRAAEAYPAKKMPRLLEPAVAVSTEKVESGIRTLRVEVLSPAGLSGTACEEYADKTRETLEALGAECIQSAVSHDGRTDLFCAVILARIPGKDEKLDLKVELGEIPLPCVAEFTAARSTSDSEETPLSGCKWTFQIREFFPTGCMEANEPEESFTMTVKRTGRTESFRGCVITGVKRVDKAGGMEQIRHGTADEMNSITIA